MRILADTSALFAYKYARDANHSAAREFMQSVAEKKVPVTRIYLSDYIFDELMTLLRAVAGVEAATSFGENIMESGGFEIVHIDEDVFEDAWKLFKERKEIARLSFTDCTTVALGKVLGLDTVFAYDAHFEKMGMGVVG